MSKKVKSDKITFGEYCRKWDMSEVSAELDYGIPISIGVIAEDIPFDKDKINNAVDNILEQLNRYFNRKIEGLDTKNGKPNKKHSNKIIVVSPQSNNCEKEIVKRIQIKCIPNNYENRCIQADYKDIAELCWITIAAWDGKSENTVVYDTIDKIINTDYISHAKDTSCGENQNITYDQINYKLRYPENRPIYEIFLPFNKTSDELDYRVREVFPHYAKPGNSKILRSNTSSSKFFSEEIANFTENARKTDESNKRIFKLRKKIYRQKKIYDTLPSHHKKKENDPNDKSIPKYADITNLRHLYYDHISMMAQNKQKHSTIMLIVISGIGLLFLSLYSDLFTHFPQFLFLYIVFMLIAYCTLFFSGRHNIHNDYLEFRSLAESLRVQCYWYMSNINESVGSYYTVKFRRDMLWAKQALNSWYLTDYLSSVKKNADVNPDPNYDIIRIEWIGYLNEEERDAKDEFDVCKKCKSGQYGFYKDRYTKNVKHSKIANIANGIFAFLSLLVSISLLVFTAIYSKELIESDPFLFLTSVLNIIAIAIACWGKVNAYPELAAKYIYCASFAKKALQDYKRICPDNITVPTDPAASNNADNAFNSQSNELTDQDKAAIQAIFKQFGIESLDELAEWLMIKNDREPEVIN